MFESIPCPHGQGWLHLALDIAVALPVVGATYYVAAKAKWDLVVAKTRRD